MSLLVVELWMVGRFFKRRMVYDGKKGVCCMSVYDQGDFLERYRKRRGRKDSPNNAIEGPILFELLGDVSQQRVLDLGCGDALFGKELLELGAASYVGVDGSRQMVDLAMENLAGVDGKVFYGNMEEFAFPACAFDVVTSRFAIHYVEDVRALFQHVHQALKDDGRFVFSVQHPLTTSSFESKQSGDQRGNWVVDDYFVEGRREEPWIEQVVVKYHRTIEEYFRLLISCGFSVVDLREGTPIREHFSSEDEYKRRLRIPVVLAFACVKKK